MIQIEMADVGHGELGMVSARIVKGEAAVRMIRYSVNPDDGWWILAAEDLPMPEVDNIMTICVHCAVKHLHPEVAIGMDLALADARENEEEVGIAVRALTGRWFRGQKAFEALDERELPSDDDDISV